MLLWKKKEHVCTVESWEGASLSLTPSTMETEIKVRLCHGMNDVNRGLSTWELWRTEQDRQKWDEAVATTVARKYIFMVIILPCIHWGFQAHVSWESQIINNEL